MSDNIPMASTESCMYCEHCGVKMNYINARGWRCADLEHRRKLNTPKYCPRCGRVNTDYYTGISYVDMCENCRACKDLLAFTIEYQKSTPGEQARHLRRFLYSSGVRVEGEPQS